RDAQAFEIDPAPRDAHATAAPVAPARPGAAPAATVAPLLRAEDLSLLYDGGRTRALDRVTFELRAQEFVAITGPSGCGKSSLLNLVGALDAPSHGRLFLGADRYPELRAAAAFRRRHFGYIFQAFHLLPTLTALDNVLVAAAGAGGETAGALRGRARALLAHLGLLGHENRHPAQMSGGERQRVAIARALINRPAVLLADEPTGSLDSASAMQVLDLIDAIRLRDGLTVVLVTHDHQVSRRADRVLRMRDGKIFW
ncbi:MAG: ABC transporter ATP-binding protein, partial [Burkholderiales bacterium]|nr:ABC transporter ATP-binding protein [Burkholderiales bacterium]